MCIDHLREGVIVMRHHTLLYSIPRGIPIPVHMGAFGGAFLSLLFGILPAFAGALFL